MENSSTLEERGRSNGCPGYPRGDLNVAFWRSRSDLRTRTVSGPEPGRQPTERVTLDKPGDGFASVLMITASFPPWWGFDSRSYVDPLTLTAWRTVSDHIPRPPPIACNFRFTREGRSRCGNSQHEALCNSLLRNASLTWNSVKPPRLPEPVAATSSATGRSSICFVRTDTRRR